MAEITISATDEGCLQVSGELVFATAPRLLAEGESLFGGQQDLVIDLGGVKRCDSAGLALLLEWLERAHDERPPELVYLKVRPEFDSLRSDPRFQELVQADLADPKRLPRLLQRALQNANDVVYDEARRGWLANLENKPEAKIHYYVMPHWPGNTPDSWRRQFYGDLAHGMKIVVVYNIKDGGGKTATSVNLAHLAAASGLRTLIWDLDPQAATTFYLRVKPKVKRSKRMLREKGFDLDDVVKGSDFINLDLLPADFSYRNMDLLLGENKKPLVRLLKLLRPLAENYDLTLTPRLMSKRGLMLSSEFRFLTSSTQGTFAADILPNDRERDTGNSTRGAASLYTYSTFNERANAALRLNYVSDSDYFEDLGGDLATTSATHLERTGVVTYHGDYWNLLGLAQYWQTIDDDIPSEDRPYSQLPLVRLDLERPDGIGGVTYHLDAEYANFHRDDSVRGHRIDLSPAFSLPLGESWWAVEPKAGAHYTTYWLTDQTAGLDDNPSNLTGVFSLDSRFYFDRDSDFFGNAVTHTLEPRAYYLYVPSSDQDDQPLFDTAPLDFDFENLFRENRFTGPDRVGDANQLTLALTSRVKDRVSGEELLRASIGQIVYFEDRTVTLADEPDQDDSTSALVTELEARLGRGWRTLKTELDRFLRGD